MKLLCIQRRESRFNEKGLSLIEIMAVVALIGVVSFAVAQLTSPIIRFFQRNPKRQEVNRDLRVCLETMERVIASGRASTVVISPPLFSAISFQSPDGSTFSISLSSQTVLLQKTVSGVTNTSILANHVSALTFGMDNRDPALINITLQMRAPLDSSGSADRILSIVMPNQTVRMIAS